MIRLSWNRRNISPCRTNAQLIHAPGAARVKNDHVRRVEIKVLLHNARSRLRLAGLRIDIEREPVLPLPEFHFHDQKYDLTDTLADSCRNSPDAAALPNHVIIRRARFADGKLVSVAAADDQACVFTLSINATEITQIKLRSVDPEIRR